MKNIILLGLLSLSFLSCASLAQQRELDRAAEQMELEGIWWNNGRQFDSLEEARYFVDLFFTKIGQISKLRSKKGLLGVLKPQGTNVLWTPPDNKIVVNWTVLAYRYADDSHVLDLSKEPLQPCQKAIIFATVWYQGRGIILSWYGLKDGYKFLNNLQLAELNDNTICEYPIGFTKNKAWVYMNNVSTVSNQE